MTRQPRLRIQTRLDDQEHDSVLAHLRTRFDFVRDRQRDVRVDRGHTRIDHLEAHVRVRFARQRLAAATLVPETAVSSNQDVKYVLVVNSDNIVEARPIGAGPVVDGMRVVESGLTPEDRVVVSGLQRAYPGAPVSPTPGKIELASR